VTRFWIMRGAPFVFMVLAFAGFLVACSKPTESKLVLGGVLPLTGDAATFGANAARGAELAVEEANAAKTLLGKTIVFKAEDSRGAPADAVSAARKLISVDGASLLIGDVTSGGTHALLPIIDQAKVPLVSPSASDPKLSGKSPWFARVWPSDTFESEVIATYAKEKGFESVAILFANTDYGVAMVDAFKKHFPETSVVATIGVDRETADYRPTLQRSKLLKADSLFIVLYPEDALRVLKQMEEQAISIPILATATFEDPKVLSAKLSDGVVFASPAPPPDSSEIRKRFIESYKAKFKMDPGVLSDTGYDAARVLIDAYRDAGVSGAAAVAERIRQFRDFDGASGRMTFDKNGDVIKEYRLKTVRDGSFNWLS
jgi:branched-chain amino acid transport system substrate-binding protein